MNTAHFVIVNTLLLLMIHYWLLRENSEMHKITLLLYEFAVDLNDVAELIDVRERRKSSGNWQEALTRLRTRLRDEIDAIARPNEDITIIEQHGRPYVVSEKKAECIELGEAYRSCLHALHTPTSVIGAAVPETAANATTDSVSATKQAPANELPVL